MDALLPFNSHTKDLYYLQMNIKTHLHTCILYMYICIIHMLYRDMQHSRTRGCRASVRFSVIDRL